MKRVLCVWLPNWPIGRLVVDRPALRYRPIVLYRQDPRHGARVAACSSAALRRGVRLAMPLSEATALVQRPSSAARNESSKLHVAEHDAAADREALERLAEWCQQFSPLAGLESFEAAYAAPAWGRPAWVVREQPECLLLDVTRLSEWFGGPHVLVHHVVRQFAGRGYFVRIALADSIGAAWAAAHFGDFFDHLPDHPDRSGGAAPRRRANLGEARLRPWILPAGQAQRWLDPLPVAALRLPLEIVSGLQQLGIERIAALRQLPREGLATRFDPLLLRRWDQALGTAPEPLLVHHAPPEFRESCSFEHPVRHRQAIAAAARPLLERLAASLRDAGRGVVQLECRLQCLLSQASPHPQPLSHRERGEMVTIRAGLFRPTADASHVWELVQMQLETCRLSGAIESMEVEAVTTAKTEARQGELFAGRANDREQLAALLDRLSSRLGAECIVRPRLHADVQPEHAFQLQPLTGSAGRRGSKKPSSPPVQPGSQPTALERPLCCFDPQPIQVWAVAPDGPPTQFSYEGRCQPIRRCWGPERIETGWWRGRMVRRDYYRVETSGGRRFWLFRRLDDGSWWLQGTFD